MNILGVGEFELVAILIIALIFIGPKGMVKWGYTLGQYTAKLRRMWIEAVGLLQKEFDDAGVDVKLPKEIPTRRTLAKQVNKALSSVTKPVQETLEEVNTELKQIKAAASVADQNGHSVKSENPTSDTNPPPSFGTWSSQGKKDD